MARARRQFSAEYKREAVRLVEDGRAARWHGALASAPICCVNGGSNSPRRPARRIRCAGEIDLGFREHHCDIRSTQCKECVGWVVG